jgi:hypothetical protein
VLVRIRAIVIFLAMFIPWALISLIHLLEKEDNGYSAREEQDVGKC